MVLLYLSTELGELALVSVIVVYEEGKQVNTFHMVAMQLHWQAKSTLFKQILQFICHMPML